MFSIIVNDMVTQDKIGKWKAAKYRTVYIKTYLILFSFGLCYLCLKHSYSLLMWPTSILLRVSI